MTDMVGFCPQSHNFIASYLAAHRKGFVCILLVLADWQRPLIDGNLPGDVTDFTSHAVGASGPVSGWRSPPHGGGCDAYNLARAPSIPVAKLLCASYAPFRHRRHRLHSGRCANDDGDARTDRPGSGALAKITECVRTYSIEKLASIRFRRFAAKAGLK